MPTPRVLTRAPWLLLTAVLAACQAPNAEDKAATAARQKAPSADASPSSQQGNEEMSALERLLAQYASATPPAWTAFETVDGVTWTEAAPTENPDAVPDHRFSRSGKLLLAGFGDTDLPNGKAGADADYVRGNEGASGVTLDGTAEHVTSIAVEKFYPDADYLKVLQAQVGAAGSVRPLASKCKLAEGTTTGEENYARNEFFEISLAGGATVFAEGSVDEDGGKYTPGSTTYFFYKEEPTERIDSMQCKRG